MCPPRDRRPTGVLVAAGPEGGTTRRSFVGALHPARGIFRLSNCNDLTEFSSRLRGYLFIKRNANKYRSELFSVGEKKKCSHDKPEKKKSERKKKKEWKKKKEEEGAEIRPWDLCKPKKKKKTKKQTNKQKKKTSPVTCITYGGLRYVRNLILWPRMKYRLC